jgi:hypothetical protein
MIIYKAIVELIVGIFKSIFEVSMEHPIDQTEGVRDVGKSHTDNPDDMFCPADW